MQYTFNKEWKVRYEYFGGLLFNSLNGSIYNISKENAIFLINIRDGCSTKEAIDITKICLNSKNLKLDIDEFIINQVIFVESKELKIDIKNQIQYINTLIFNASNKNALSAPIEASIYPTSKCQLRCSFCYYKDKKKQYCSIESFDQWKKVISDLHNANVFYLSILGGEPTLYPFIDEILKFVDKLGFRTTITTNGVNLNESTIKIISNSKYITPAVSIQSLNKKNKELTGADFSCVVKTIKSFLNNKKIPRVNTVLVNQEFEEITKLIDFLETNNIEEFGLNIYLDINEPKHNFNYYRNINEKIIKYINDNNYKIYFSLQGCMLYSAYPEIDSPIITEFDLYQYGCEAGKTKLEVLPNGDVYPCVSFSHKSFYFDNAFRKDIIDIWNNSKYFNQLRNIKNEDQGCKICKFYNFCKGGCPARNLHNYGNFEDKGDNQCQILMDKK